jgi:GIY-YIG catalytic domain
MLMFGSAEAVFLMPIQAQWWSFVESVIEVDRDDPGVYELGDKDGNVVYIGSSNELRRRLKEHLNEASYTCIRQNTTHYRIEYTPNFQNRERELYAGHVRIYGKPPECNNSRPAS